MDKKIMKAFVDSHKELEEKILDNWLKNDEFEIELFFLSPTDVNEFLEEYNINIINQEITNSSLFIEYEDAYNYYYLTFNYYYKDLNIKCISK